MNGRNSSDKATRNSIILILCLFTVFVSTVAVLVYLPLIARWNPQDPYPEISTLTPNKIIEFGGSPTNVKVGLYIRDIPLFDQMNSRFIVDLVAIFKFDHREISLDRIGKFKFDRARIIEQSPPQTKIDGHNLIARYDMKIELNTTLNFKNFPIDDHRLNISMTNYNLTPSEAIFNSAIQDLVINPDIKVAGWDLVEKSVKTGFLTDTTSSEGEKKETINYPRAIFSIDFSNAGLRQIITLLIPLLIIFLIATITVSFESGDNTNITISIATITALIAYKFVIENMSPKTGYLIMADLFFLYIFFGCIAIFIFNLFSSGISRRNKNITIILLYIVYTALFAQRLYSLLT